MTLVEAIYEHSQRLPEAAAREVLDFIEFLEQRYGKQVQAAAAPRRQAGSAAGKLMIIEDNDTHLDDFKDYIL